MFSKLVDNGISPLSIPCSQESSKLSCKLLWRGNKLWVGKVNQYLSLTLPALEQEDWFHTCLIKSKVDAVCIDPGLGTELIWQWAQACVRTHKPLYLRHPSCHNRPSIQKPISWMFMRLCDFLGAGILLIFLSPLFVTITALIKLQDGGPVLSTHWRIGQRGRLFQALHFRITSVDDYTGPNSLGIRQSRHALPKTRLGLGLWRTHLNKLPLLLNVLRGDMSLVGPHAWAIHEVVDLPVELRTRFSLLPGITGTWWTFPPCEKPDFNQVVKQELKSIASWSLAQDMITLARTATAIITSPLLGRPTVARISPSIFSMGQQQI